MTSFANVAFYELEASQKIYANEVLSAYNKHTQLYKLFRKSDNEMAEIFDDYRRSTAIIQLNVMLGNDLITEAELSQFSDEVQNICTLFRSN